MNPESDRPTVEEQAARIFGWRQGFNALHIIDLGERLGLFAALAAAPGASADGLAARLGLHPPYVAIWCKTAYSLALLDGDSQGFRLAPHIGELLADPGHPRYLGGYVRLGTEFATDDYRRAEALFRNGQSVPFQGRGERFADTIAQATAGLQVLAARKLLPSLPGLAEALAEGGVLLEVGCGAGKALLQMAKAFPKARLVGVDLDPDGIALARAAIARAGLEARVEIKQRPLDQAVAADSCAAVVMIQVLHEIEPAIRPGVLAGAARALAPGGWLLIVDETYPETLAELRQPEFRFPIQTGIEELLWGNVVPTRSEQERLLTEAGFTGPLERALVGEGFTVLSTRKP
ncbi:MAG: class I SAM-dependent methyltransferase [Rhodospirillales bacterium]|nr:class I SAM-dependent methyltransferase [Rhodospirillales bacterium]